MRTAHLLPRAAKFVTGALVSLVAAAPALAQEAPSERWVTLVPAETGDTGTP